MNLLLLQKKVMEGRPGLEGEVVLLTVLRTSRMPVTQQSVDINAIEG